ADGAPRTRLLAGTPHARRNVDALRRRVPRPRHRAGSPGVPGRARPGREPGRFARPPDVALALQLESVRPLRARLERGRTPPDDRCGLRRGAPALRPRTPRRPCGAVE